MNKKVLAIGGAVTAVILFFGAVCMGTAPKKDEVIPGPGIQLVNYNDNVDANYNESDIEESGLAESGNIPPLENVYIPSVGMGEVSSYDGDTHMLTILGEDSEEIGEVEMCEVSIETNNITNNHENLSSVEAFGDDNYTSSDMTQEYNEIKYNIFAESEDDMSVCEVAPGEESIQ